MGAENQEQGVPQDEVTRQGTGDATDSQPEAGAGAGDALGEVVEGEVVDELAGLAADLAAVQAQAAEYLDGWQRARAEFANYRRRQEQLHKQQAIAAQSRLLTQLLPVVDDLERAFQAVPDALADEPWVGGIMMVRSKWLNALERVGMAEVNAAPGERFDPNCHEALTHEPNDQYAEGTVIEVVQRGYRFEDLVLRPALVRVSSGAPAEACEQGNDGGDA